MDLIDYNELTDLLEQREAVHVSLFMPLEWEPENRQANHIRLKNLIKQGQQQLAAENFLPPDLPVSDEQQLFQPAQEFLDNGRFLSEKSRGLAIFLAPGMERIYHLPLSLAERVVIGPRFHVTPLLPVLEGNGRFYLLALSQNQVQLWQGNQFALQQIDVAALPAGMSEALALEDPERSLQFHTSTEQGADRPAVFYGHDADKEKKGAILRYCREVNKVVQEQLADEKTPLLLASVAYLQPIYQEANTYPHLLPEAVSGNPDNLSADELHEQAWQVAQKHLEQPRKEATDQYRQLADTENTSHSLTEIVPAAAYGRVDTLFVPMDVQVSGRFDKASSEVEMCEADIFDCEDLLNLAATTTLLQGGTIYTVQPQEMPDEAQIAAIFRYAV